MSRVLKTMRQSLANEGLESNLVVPGTGEVIPLQDVSFIDDMALPLVDSAGNLIQHIADVCGIVLLVFRMFGVELNFSLGKSAVVLQL